MADPSTIPNLIAWNDATHITGQSDNTLLSSWPATTGTPTYDLQQSGTFRPTYYNTTSAKLINGQPALWFSGGQMMYVSPTQAAIAQPCTVFCTGGVSAVSGTQTLFDNDSGSVGVKLQLSGGNWVATAGSTITGPAATTGQHFFIIVANGASSQLIVDGVSTAGSAGSSGEQYINVGSDSGAGTKLTGFVCEIGIYSRAINSTEITTLVQYAGAKWGTAGGTPTGTATLSLGPITTTASGTATWGTFTGTATLALGPLSTTTVPSTPVWAATSTIALGPLSLTTLPLWTQPFFTIGLGPLTTTSTSISFAVVYLTNLGPITTTVSSSTAAGGGSFVFIESSP